MVTSRLLESSARYALIWATIRGAASISRKESAGSILKSTLIGIIDGIALGIFAHYCPAIAFTFVLTYAIAVSTTEVPQEQFRILLAGLALGAALNFVVMRSPV